MRFSIPEIDTRSPQWYKTSNTDKTRKIRKVWTKHSNEQTCPNSATEPFLACAYRPLEECSRERSSLKHRLFSVILFVGVVAQARSQVVQTQTDPNRLLLKDYSPHSIYKIPVSKISRAKYPVIDMHSHPYAKTPAEVRRWVANMDASGIEKTTILTKLTGTEFEKVQQLYNAYPGRFELWAGLDFSQYQSPHFTAAACSN
jgi:hypothetical protein